MMRIEKPYCWEVIEEGWGHYYESLEKCKKDAKAESRLRPGCTVIIQEAKTLSEYIPLMKIKAGQERN